MATRDGNPCFLPEVDICAKYNITNAWCPPGWNALVCDALDQIFALPFASDIEIHQIKEKFGTLRIYYGIKDPRALVGFSINEAVDLIVREAELKADKTCERCGEDSHENYCQIPQLPR